MTNEETTAFMARTELVSRAKPDQDPDRPMVEGKNFSRKRLAGVMLGGVAVLAAAGSLFGRGLVESSTQAIKGLFASDSPAKCHFSSEQKAVRAHKGWGVLNLVFQIKGIDAYGRTAACVDIARLEIKQINHLDPHHPRLIRGHEYQIPRTVELRSGN